MRWWLVAKVLYFREKCIGCGVCVGTAPEQWEMSFTDGKSVLKNAELRKDVFVLVIPSFASAVNKQAAEACPVKIIQVLE
ncbi:ferredoxin [Candidatus Woesearchaeota archaeon]|nr:ferredoxin [Candidatus Woesearchaeota archaeon]